ncbi:ADP-forming succinate--CoA ligase subunit beta [Piscinibacter sp. XHJ-5]|uniref:ADP-forming succinate--CoA ligase subunit beta n=1 Tax=Piscinibacter sp. XHJ-5 TaxID=3037797 RepID=UPI00245325CF|nr:ADP-forming succinate--CoA ligase subunit beta [Piscinibacter sp. XHJ-5]
MNLHEHQAKHLLRQHGISTPAGVVCASPDEAAAAAAQLGGSEWVLKAQVHGGVRGVTGGIKVARSAEDLRRHAAGMLGTTLVTRSSGPAGRLVKRVLVEEHIAAAKAVYVGLTIDRASRRVALIASSRGGMDIVEVAAHTPDRIHKVVIPPLAGLARDEAEAVARRIGIAEAAIEPACDFMQALYRAFDANDALLAEVNPLVVTPDHRVIALDAKFDIDASALFRHPDLAALRDPEQEDPDETEAAAFDLDYVRLDGNIGCIVNGAGLAMATMDLIKLYGGAPANFLDVGGGATAEQVTEAFKLMTRNRQLDAILVNIFGGIMRCDVIATGIVEAVRQADLTVPLVVRMKGTNEGIGKKILEKSGLPIRSAKDMADAAVKVVQAAAGR